MSLSLFVLASGSKANSFCLSGDNCKILIDAGLGVRSMLPALHSVGVRPDEISAVFLTHEHTDHVRGLSSLLSRSRATVYASDGTLERVDYMLAARAKTVTLDHETVEVGPFAVKPISVPHDAAGPLAYHVIMGRHRITVATDLGEVPADLQIVLKHSTCAVFESNHDEEMLRNGPYPEILKTRIASATGHLSNKQSAAALSECRGNGLRTVVLAHISDENNHSSLARDAVQPVLEWEVGLHITSRLATGPFLDLDAVSNN
ncbi:MAG: MBL fold metallo-hydrolase [Calditrichota bacterium]